MRGRSTVSMSCPFCKGPLEVFDNAVLHGLPACTKYDQLDAAEFLAAVNATLVPQPN